MIKLIGYIWEISHFHCCFVSLVRPLGACSDSLLTFSSASAFRRGGNWRRREAESQLRQEVDACFPRKAWTKWESEFDIEELNFLFLRLGRTPGWTRCESIADFSRFTCAESICTWKIWNNLSWKIVILLVKQFIFLRSSIINKYQNSQLSSFSSNNLELSGKSQTQMPERSSKRKARRDSESSSLNETETASQRTENVLSFPDRDFSEISEKIEKSVSKRIKDTEIGQREILKLIKNLSSKIDSLSGQTPRTENSEVDHVDIENQASTSRSTVINELPPLEGQHMVTVVFPQTEIPPRLSSLQPPNQKYPHHIVDKLLESLQNVTQENIGLPRLPKALSTTVPTFNGRNDKFEHFDDLFMTSLKVYRSISEEEQIHYFHSLLRDDALQTYRNMTDRNRASLEDIVATFRRLYVRPQSIATAAANVSNKPQILPNCQAHAMDADKLATLSRIARKQPAKLAIEATEYPTKLSNHTTQDCYSGAGWANRPQWWKTPRLRPQTTIRYHHNHKVST